MRMSSHLHKIYMKYFPIVHHDHEALNGQHYFTPPFMGGKSNSLLGLYSSRPDAIYGEPMGLNNCQPHIKPSALHGHLNKPFLHSMGSSPHGSFHKFEHIEDSIKLEDTSPVIVPSQTAFYRPSSGVAVPMFVPYLSPHTSLPVQHTNDAASKETQYLRQQCFNCHTTEPPSWHHSTLNPGKIVCNKCGLYEHTHLHPHPLHFNKLCVGNKARKHTKGVLGSLSPKQKLGGLMKKGPREFAVTQRSSILSTASSVNSAGTTSDWDDNGALRVIMHQR